ncbi:MAG: hypothetical protein H5U01_04145, partial [Clostridia bacterium]|nr:hypothetical protein [Clostridia bacterium]
PVSASVIHQRCLVHVRLDARAREARPRLTLSAAAAALLGQHESGPRRLQVVNAARLLAAGEEAGSNLAQAGFICLATIAVDNRLPPFEAVWEGELGPGGPELGRFYLDLLFPAPGSGLAVVVAPSALFAYYFTSVSFAGTADILLHAPHEGASSDPAAEEYTGALAVTLGERAVALARVRGLSLGVTAVYPRAWRWGRFPAGLSHQTVDLARASGESAPLKHTHPPLVSNANPSYQPVREAYHALLRRYPRAAVALHGLGSRHPEAFIFGLGVAEDYRLTPSERATLEELLGRCFGEQFPWRIGRWGKEDARLAAGPIWEVGYAIRLDEERRRRFAEAGAALLVAMVEAGLLTPRA